MKKNKIPKRKKRIVIIKGRDIEDLVAQEEEKQEIESTELKEQLQENEKIEEEEVGRVTLEEKRQQFIESLSIENAKYNNFVKRREAEAKEEEKRIELLKAMEKLQEGMSEEEIDNEKEIQGFFDSIQKRTDAYIIKQNEERIRKQSEQYKEDKITKKKRCNELKKEKSKEKNKTSGTSMSKILTSPEFKKMWEDSEQEVR